MLSEQEAMIRWRQIFSSREITSQLFDQAKRLIDKLGAESPLRHRLNAELAELRELHPKSR